MAYVLVVDGIVVQKQPDFTDGFIAAPDNVICGFLWDGNEFTEPSPPEPAPLPPTPFLYAVAQLVITPGSIGGIDVNSRFAAALYLDVGSYLLFFAEPLLDTSYLAKAYDDATKVRVTERTTDYIVITVTDDNGDPADPAEISVEIIRVS